MRESNVELQVAVGNKIFVFGKAKGTLDKLKVGMNVLHFSQSSMDEASSNEFSTVMWKKQKDGSILIKSSYKPWPNSLSWTVFADGRLKLEVSSPSSEISNSKWAGLGFNYPDQLLNQISWNSSDSESGNWKNLQFTPMADPTLEIEGNPTGFLMQIRSVKMEFESVILDVSTETSDIFLGLGDYQNPDSSYPTAVSDLVFYFNPPLQEIDKPLQSPSDQSSFRPNQPKEQLVLWFHFR
ncbi:hypothetical protein [Algoriphagus litoralis]|uniref:hypothetical protein n=1 Tax=Algoriphagus litoralis TaxID=2202829 RepID=UPI00130080D6|nr:hypothetical protein [Algoriphagus litoralis]